jgi:hypothetical protein
VSVVRCSLSTRLRPSIPSKASKQSKKMRLKSRPSIACRTSIYGLSVDPTVGFRLLSLSIENVDVRGVGTKRCERSLCARGTIVVKSR